MVVGFTLVDKCDRARVFGFGVRVDWSSHSIGLQRGRVAYHEIKLPSRPSVKHYSLPKELSYMGSFIESCMSGTFKRARVARDQKSETFRALVDDDN